MKKFPLSRFPERLKELKNEKGISNIVLGKNINVDNSTICRWEKGENDVKGEYLIRLALFFDVTVGYLLGLED